MNRIIMDLIRAVILTVMVICLPGCYGQQAANEFVGVWQEGIARTWVGPEYWSNHFIEV